MIKNVIFLVEVTFNQRDYERFGIELLKKNGFNVNIWDITPIVNPNFAKNYMPPDPFKLPGYKVFNDKTKISNELENLSSHTFVFNFVGYSKKTIWLYKAISKAGLKYAVFMANALPSVSDKEKKRIFSVFKKIHKASPKELKKYFRNYFSKIISKISIKPANLILAGGMKCFKFPYPRDKSTEILWVHTLDYDVYLNEKNLPFTLSNTAVFLDEYLPFHPDLLVSGNKPMITADKYYPLLIKFFTHLEQKLGLKVVIAAHPRSQYEKHPDYFEGRKYIRGETLRLIRESRLVIVHSSTAINYANLFEKPVMFITTRDLDKSKQGPIIRIMADWFGKKPIFIDNDYDNINWKEEMEVNVNNYTSYRRAYIKTEKSEDILFWQIVANRLKNLE